MSNFFKVKEHGSTVHTEIMAGVTTFMAMAYILMVNAGMFANLGTVSYGAIYIATAISAVIGTVLIGLLSNLPLAQASGMGLNAFFVYTVCFTFGLSYANALVLVLVDGIVFVLLTVTGLRKMIFDAIPAAVKTAISAGIGLFIAFIGLQNAGIVVDDGATLVNLSSFNVFSGTATWATIFPMLVTIIAVFAIGAMSKKKVKGAVLWGMLGGAVLYYVIGLITVPDFYATAVAPNLSSDFFGAFKDFGTQAFGKVFTEGFDFSPYIAEHGMSNFIVMFLTTMLAFCMVDMFDTLGTLYGACAAGNMLTKEGNVPNMDKAMLADAVATCCGAVCGTSTVTTFVESSAGVAEGRRTVCAPVCDEEYLEKMTPDFWLPDLTDEKKNGWAFYLHYTKDAADGMVGVCHKTGEIGHLFVTEAARGKGYGAKMLDFARKKLPEHDHPTMGVINTNTRAIALYKRMGWRLTGTVLHRYDPAEEGTFAAVYCEELEMQYRG